MPLECDHYANDRAPLASTESQKLGSGRSRVFMLMYMKAHSPIAHLIKGNLLKLIDTVVEQDARILSKIYANAPQRIKLNHEVGMDWVRRNFANFPNVVEPNFSR